jgi:hypothetical protein
MEHQRELVCHVQVRSINDHCRMRYNDKRWNIKVNYCVMSEQGVLCSYELI